MINTIAIQPIHRQPMASSRCWETGSAAGFVAAAGVGTGGGGGRAGVRRKAPQPWVLPLTLRARPASRQAVSAHLPGEQLPPIAGTRDFLLSAVAPFRHPAGAVPAGQCAKCERSRRSAARPGSTAAARVGGGSILRSACLLAATEHQAADRRHDLGGRDHCITPIYESTDLRGQLVMSLPPSSGRIAMASLDPAQKSMFCIVLDRCCSQGSLTMWASSVDRYTFYVLQDGDRLRFRKTNLIAPEVPWIQRFALRSDAPHGSTTEKPKRTQLQHARCRLGFYRRSICGMIVSTYKRVR